MQRTKMILLTTAAVLGGGTFALAKLPSWDTVKPPQARFRVLPAMNDEAVLDKETGLVWERTWHGSATFRSALRLCGLETTGGRAGWRLPSVEELTSLIDPAETTPALPEGHPFENVTLGNFYWSANEDEADSSSAVTVNFDVFDLSTHSKGNTRPFVCVRGGRGSTTGARGGF